MQRIRNWQNIGRQLPLLTTVLLSVAVSAIASTAYYEMKEATVGAEGEHLLNVSKQISGIFIESEAKLRREGSPLSHDSAIVAVLATTDAGARRAAQQVLTRRANTPPTYAVELWDAAGNRVLAAGQPLASTTPIRFGSIVNPLIAKGDTVLTDVRVPVILAGDTLGYVRELSRPVPSQAKQVVGLIGPNARLLIGNSTGDVWTDFDKHVDGPAAGGTPGVSYAVGTDGTEYLGALSAVPSTPWLIWVALPSSDVLAGVHAFLLRMTLVAIVVVVLGAFGAHLLSRHIIAPLSEVTRAAESIAEGDYSIRVKPVRRDEVGRLAEAFSTMASAIEHASMELENQQVELEAQQAELQESNEELRHSLAAVTQARESAERSRVRAAAIVAGALDSIITIDDDETIVEFNPAAERLFGVTVANAVGRPITEFIVAEQPAGFANDGVVRRLDLASRIGRRMELHGRRADGSLFSLELSVTRTPIAGSSMYTSFIRDLSERKQLEAQLQQAQKMEAVGRLAGGVAHDFNNMLTVMISYTDLVLGNREIDSGVRSDLTQVRSAADRAATLTRQLLAFSRKQVLRPSVLDVNEVVGGVITMLARVMPENIRLSSTLGSALDAIFVDRGQLEQVLMNLAVNARDAMPEGGSLSIETANSVLDDSYVGFHADGAPGPHVVLSVRDSGIGMDAATRERIFEPFFTTKPVGQGTGLGLATVYGIVQQSGGTIYVYSEPGLGTIFKVYFPAYRDAIDARRDSRPVAVAPVEPMMVLLVEDDPAVRDATRVVLRSLGHTVVAAPDVGTALDIVRAGNEHFDAVLTDAVMPGQSGLELARILSVERPDLPIVLMSGYAEETIDYNESKMPGVLFVEKPFTAQVIARALSEVKRTPLSVRAGA